MRILNFYFGFKGRISRRAYALGFFLALLVPLTALHFVLWKTYTEELFSLATQSVTPVSPDNALLVVAYQAYSLLFLWIGVAVRFKRFHDIGWSGFVYIGLSFVPSMLFGIAIVVVVLTAAFFEPASAPDYALNGMVLALTEGNLLKLLGELWNFLSASPLSQGLGALALLSLIGPEVVLLFWPGQEGDNAYGDVPTT